MRRLVPAALAAALLAPAAALGDYEPGSYRGETRKEDPVSFSAGEKVKNFKWRKVRLECTDGDSFNATSRSPQGSTFAVTEKGRFSFKVVNDVGVKWTVRGRLEGETASGTLKTTARFDADNNPSADGSVKCTSGRLKWKAELK